MHSRRGRPWGRLWIFASQRTVSQGGLQPLLSMAPLAFALQGYNHVYLQSESREWCTQSGVSCLHMLWVYLYVPHSHFHVSWRREYVATNIISWFILQNFLWSSAPRRQCVQRSASYLMLLGGSIGYLPLTKMMMAFRRPVDGLHYRTSVLRIRVSRG